jgi:PAS domain S-box-containing protein
MRGDWDFAEVQDMRNKRALVVDNDFFFMEFLAEVLEARDYEVIKAYDGKEGISKLEQENIDLILVDMIMPKIDGGQLIRFIRSKYPATRFPIIALSIIEQMDGLTGIDADYFIAKSPAEKMAVHIDMVLERIEKRLIAASTDEVMIQPEDMIPRHITSELIQSVNFQQAITESIGVGVIVVDRDARIITANSLALDIIEKSYDEVLNREASSVFPKEERPKVMDSLRSVLQRTELRNMSIFLLINSLKVQTIISLLRLGGETLGWVMSLCPEPGISQRQV